MSSTDPVARARELGALLDELASLAERYDALASLVAGEPGRTEARRDAMRAVAERFPGALRELDAAGPALVAERGAAVRALLSRVVAELDALPALLALAATEHAAMRAAAALQPRLREAVRLKRWLAAHAPGPPSEAARARVRAWYRNAAGARDAAAPPADDYIDRVAAPPGGRVQQVAYELAAAALGVTVDGLKAALYPPAAAACDHEEEP